MELLMPVVLDGALLGAIAFIPIAVVSALRGRYLNGTLLGAASVALQMVFGWLWYSAFIRPGEGKNWMEFALAKANVAEIAILVCGLLVTLINILLLVKQKTLSKENVWN